MDKRWKITYQPPTALPEIDRVTSVKILGVTFTNSLSVEDYVNNTISSCTQTLMLLRFCVAMEWMTHHSKLFFVPLLSLNCNTRPVRGTGSLVQQRSTELMHCFH